MGRRVRRIFRRNPISGITDTIGITDTEAQKEMARQAKEQQERAIRAQEEERQRIEQEKAAAIEREQFEAAERANAEKDMKEMNKDKYINRGQDIDKLKVLEGGKTEGSALGNIDDEDEYALNSAL